MPKIIHNIHVYLVGDQFYLCTLVKESSGLWIEILPVTRCGRDENELGAAIQQMKEHSIKGLNQFQPWNGENGSVWVNSKKFWSIYWYDDHSLAIVPKYPRTLETDPETGKILDGGWADDSDKKVVLAEDTSAREIARILFRGD